MRAARVIDPGRLRARLVLEQATPAPDGAGGFTPDWTPVATLFGHVGPVTAQSRFGAGQGLETATHVVTIRHRDDVRGGMRFSIGTRRMAIGTAHDPDGTGRYLQCGVKEERP